MPTEPVTGGRSGADGVERIGVGGWQLGLKGWGHVTERDAVAALVEAHAAGMRLFDTAPIYGLGHSEELLGESLADAGDEVTIVTKGGLVWDSRGRVGHDNRPESLRSQLEASLRRLRRDAVDVYLLHWPDAAVPLDDSIAALETLRTEGRLRRWGLSNHARSDVERLAARTWPTQPVLQFAWNLLGNDEADLGEAARRAKCGTIAYDILARGLLGGRYSTATRFGKKDVRRRDARFAPAELEGNLARVETVRQVAQRLGRPCAAVALRAALDLSGADTCIVGMKTPAQALEILQATEFELPDATLQELAALRR